MNQRLSRNNFDLLRFLFAGTVCLVHTYELSGFVQLQWISKLLSSEVAVKAFFVISGFLIFMSYERSSSVGAYAVKRIRRIYPAYLVVVIACAVLLVGATSRDYAGYFSSDWLRYVFANLAFLNFVQPTLPGVFEGNRVPAINGALWTLKIEVMFYAAVPVFVWLFRRFGHFSILLISYCASVAYASILTAQAARTGSDLYLGLARQLPGQLAYFMSGAFFYYFLPLFERRVGSFVGISLLVLLAHAFYPLPILEPFALAAVVVFFGLFAYVGNFGKYGDFSYGVYVLHFPLIQFLVHAGWGRNDALSYFVTAVLATLASAIAMWFLVERPFLLRNSHYVSPTGTLTPDVPAR